MKCFLSFSFKLLLVKEILCCNKTSRCTHMRDCFSNICKTDQPKSLSQGVPQLDIIILGSRWGPGRLNYFGHLPGHVADNCL